MKKLFTRITAIVLTIAVLFSVIPTTALASGNKETGNDNNGKNYIVSFRNENAKEKVAKDKTKGKKVKKNIEDTNALVLQLNEQEALEMQMSTDVSWVEEDGSVEILSVGEPQKNHNAVKNMKNGEQEMPWGIRAIGGDINLNKYDGKKVKVAIFDTGVSPHEDLTVKGGISFVDYTDSYSDDNGHGTHVAGTIAANNNRIGVVGAAPNAEIYAVKILDSQGGGNYSSIIAALAWSVDNNIDIINMSLGGSQDSKILQEAIQEAVEHGIIIVAAAGNRGDGLDTLLYPAKYPEVISVGAVNDSFEVAGFSSRGFNLDIVAPGTSILSTANDGKYAVLSGTSMAAPHVSGALAALKSKNKKMTSAELVRRIYETATPLGQSNSYGRGLLNFAYAAGEVNDSVPLINDSPSYIPSEDVIHPVYDVSAIHAFDIRLNELNDKLNAYAQIAYNNNDLDLAKEISSASDQLITQMGILHELPEHLKNPSKDFESSANFESLADEFYSGKENELDALAQEYSDLIDRYSSFFELQYPAPDETELIPQYDFHEIIEKSDDSELDEAPDSRNISAVFEADDVNRDNELDLLSEQMQAESVYAEAVPSISVISTTATSVTFSVTFPYSGQYCNILSLDNHNVAQPYMYKNFSPLYGWYMTNGTYTYNGLTPGGFYYLKMMWSTDGGKYYGGDNTKYCGVQLPYNTTESLVRTDGTYVYSEVESADKALATTANFSTWLNRMDQTYAGLKDLTGYTPYSGNKIGIKSSRNTPVYTNGQNYWKVTVANAGNPATFYRPFYRSFIQRLSSGDWSNTAIHELSHDFDKSAWEFDPEVLADFKAYYVVETNNAKVYTYDQESWYTGSAYANFFKTDHRLWSYSNNFPNGYYTPQGMVWLMINIKNQIGWQPFKDTFRFFNTLSNPPAGSMAKFNLFLSKLKDFSGKDVFAMLNANDKKIIGNQYGGTVAYTAPVTATVITANTPVDVNSMTEKILKFTPTATAVYSIFTGPYAGTGSSNDTYLELYSDASLTNRIDYNDDYSSTLFSGINRTLTGGVTYYIKLRHFNSTSQIYARITVAKSPPALSLNVPADVSLQAGQYAVYKFTPTASGTYNIYTGPYGGTGAGNDTYLELYSDEGLNSRIAYNDDYDGLFSKISFNMTANKSYYIKLRHYNAASGAVHARLSVTSFVPAITVSLNNPTAISITSGARREVKFTAPSAGTYKFESSNRGSLDPKAYISVTGTNAHNDDGGPDGRNYMFQIQLTAGQTFTFYSGVYNDSNISGSYTLTVMQNTANQQIEEIRREVKRIASEYKIIASDAAWEEVVQSIVRESKLNPDGTYLVNWEAALESINMASGNWSVSANFAIAPESQEEVSSLVDASSLAQAWSLFAASVTTAVVSVETALASSWVPVVAAAAAVVAAIAIVVIIDQAQKYMATAEQIREVVKQRADARTADKEGIKNYSVYIVRKIATAEVHYVGMTSNFHSRQQAHLGGSYPRFQPAKQYEMIAVYTNFTKEEARSMEQSLIMAYTLEGLTKMLGGNKINSIAPSKMKNFKEQLKRVEDLLSKEIPE